MTSTSVTGPGARTPVAIGRVGAPRPSPEIAPVSVATGLVSEVESAAIAPAAALAAGRVSAAEPTDRLPVRDRQHGLRRDPPRGLGREPQHDQRGTARRASVPGVATAPLDRAIAAASMAAFVVCTEATVVFGAAVFTAAEVGSVVDGVLILGLSTISLCLAISTTA